MIIKITKWLLLIIAFKMIVALIVTQLYNDPRRDIAARKKLSSAFNPNTVFIGTSRTLYGIDPALFDSANLQQTRSYNFGIFSLSPYSSIQIADDLLSESPAVKTIFIELSALDFSTVALQPHQVIQDAVFRANVMADCPTIDLHTKVGSFLDGLNTTLFQMISIAPQILAIKKVLNPDIDPVEGNADLLHNGHQSVTSALSKTTDQIIANRRSTEQMLTASRPSAPNTYYISQIDTLISRARKIGKKVIFYYPNNITRAEYQILSQVAPFLPDENLIPLPGQALLDTLFKPENLFDAHHLNRKGASIFTRYLQEKGLKKFSM